MADNIIQIEIEIDGKKGFAAFKKDAFSSATAAGEEVAKGVGAGFTEKFSGFVTPLKAAIAAIGAIAAGSVFKSAIEASNEQATAIHELSIALANAGRFSEEAKNGFIAFADQIQQTTKFSDDFVISLEKTATNFAKTNEDALKLTEAAIQLSAATGIDANTAVEKLGLSLQGVSRGLNLAIPGFTKTSEEALKTGAALDFVLDKFGGTAQAQVNTFGGALAKAKNSFDELLESIGDIVTKSPAAVAVITEIGKMLLRAAESVKGLGKNNGFNDVTIGALNFALVIADNVLPIIETLKNAFLLFVNVAAGAIQEFLIIPLLSVADAAATVGNAIGATSDQTAQTFSDLKDAAFTALDEINMKALESAGAIEEFPLTARIREMLETLQTAAVNAPIAADAIHNGVGPKLVELAKKAEITAKQINTAFNQSLAQGVANGVQNLTKALIAGENGFAAFGKAILGIMGDIAIQLGAFFIAQGIAQLALASNPLTAGGAIVAAGIGLVVLGTLLKSLSGSSGGPAAGPGSASAGGGGGDSGGGIGSTQTDIPDQETQKPQTQVVVNVQGNVLDRRETGLELVNVLNEYFDTNDGVVART